MPTRSSATTAAMTHTGSHVSRAWTIRPAPCHAGDSSRSGSPRSLRMIASRRPRAAPGDPGAALEAELKAPVHQLEDVSMRVRVLGEPAQELEELLAAAGLAAAQRQQAGVGPRAR